MPSENFKKVGLMDENLFIDGVDNEWCWRAKTTSNLDSFILLDTAIEHYFGGYDNITLECKDT